MKKPLTFAERNVFLIVGLIVLFCTIGGVCGIWLFFLHQHVDCSQKLQIAEIPKLTKPDSHLELARSGGVILTGQVVDDSPRTINTKAPAFVDLHFDNAEMNVRTESGLAVLQKFMLASDWEEKSHFVHDAARIRSAMQRHYEMEKLADLEPRRMKSRACYQFGGGEILHISFTALHSEKNVEVAFRRVEGESYTLDWESYSGASETGWDEVQSTRPTKPVLLRALANLDDYYNYEFDDPSHFLCVRLQRADSTHTLYAFCPRDSSTASALHPQLGKGRIAPLTVRITYPKNAQSNNCVELVEVVANRWLLP